MFNRALALFALASVSITAILAQANFEILTYVLMFIGLVLPLAGMLVLWLALLRAWAQINEVKDQMMELCKQHNAEQQELMQQQRVEHKKHIDGYDALLKQANSLVDRALEAGAR